MYKNFQNYTIETIDLLSRNGTKISLLQFYTNITIYEDIDTPFITAKLNVKETINILEKYNVYGNENIIIKISMLLGERTHTIVLNLVVGNIDRVTKPSASVNEYTIRLVHPDYFKSLTIKESKRYQGNAAKVFSEIYDEHFQQQLQYDTSINDIDFVAPIWSPLKSLQYIQEHCYSVSNKYTFKFFQTCNASVVENTKFNDSTIISKFIDISHIKNEKYYDEIDYQNMGNDSENKLYNTKSLMMETTANVGKSIMNGEYSGRYIHYNTITRNFNVASRNTVDNKYSAMMDKYGLLNQDNANRIFKIADKNIDKNILLDSMSIQSQLDNSSIVTTLNGKITRQVGQLFKVNVTEKDAVGSANSVRENNYMGGFYISKSVVHTFTKEDYTNTVELFRYNDLRRIDV